MNVIGVELHTPSRNELIRLAVASDEGQHACVVISPDTKSVDVLVGFPDSPARETWIVERDGDRTMLQRADGSYLTEAK